MPTAKRLICEAPETRDRLVLVLAAFHTAYSRKPNVTVAAAPMCRKQLTVPCAARGSGTFDQLRPEDKIFGPLSSSSGDKLPDWIGVNAR